MEKDFYVPFAGFPNARVISSHCIVFVHRSPFSILVVKDFRLLDITVTSLSTINISTVCMVESRKISFL